MFIGAGTPLRRGDDACRNHDVEARLALCLSRYQGTEQLPELVVSSKSVGADGIHTRTSAAGSVLPKKSCRIVTSRIGSSGNIYDAGQPSRQAERNTPSWDKPFDGTEIPPSSEDVELASMPPVQEIWSDDEVDNETLYSLIDSIYSTSTIDLAVEKP